MNPDLVHDTVFDLLQAGAPNTGWLAASAVALVIALAVLAWRRRRGGRLAMPRFFAGAAALMLAVCTFTVWDHHRLAAALREGRALVVEGPLQSYNVQHRVHYNSSSKRYERSIAESFYVGTLAFGYVRSASVAGFTNSGDHAIEFTDGEVLRVHYVEDTAGDWASRRIVRLERRPVLGAGTRAAAPG